MLSLFVFYHMRYLKSGIRLLGDLILYDKGIDTDHILQKVKVKHNIFIKKNVLLVT